MAVSRLGRGIYVHIPTFFNEDEELDLVALDQYIENLFKTGISGFVVLGSMGEAVALTEQERLKVIEQSAKSVYNHNPDLKIIAGTSARSAKATVGNAGKMSDLLRKTDPKDITLLAGSAEFFFTELMMGVAGLVLGSGNIFSHVCVEIQSLYESNQFQQAIDLQDQLVKLDQALFRWKGISGIKSYIHRKFDYGNGICRTPLYKQEDITTIESAVDKMWEIEQALDK